MLLYNLIVKNDLRSESIGHGSVSAIDPATLRSGKTSSFSRERPKTARLIKEEVPEQQVNEEDPEDIPETDRSGSQRALSSFNTNRRNFREPPSSAQRPVRNRQNLSPESTKRRTPASPDLSGQASIQHETVSTDFAAKKRNNFRDRNPGLTRYVDFFNSGTACTIPKKEFSINILFHLLIVHKVKHYF